ATFDGMAIAHAVLERLVHNVGCRTLFATHYHLLAEEHEAGDRGASVHRMACNVDEGTREVTFLYRYERGSCLHSHGVNVARLAGLPAALLDSATERSAHMEKLT
ncbi:DNA mismatch repair protein MutS, partial [Pavlovales sp. CCMP2436]